LLAHPPWVFGVFGTQDCGAQALQTTERGVRTMVAQLGDRQKDEPVQAGKGV